MANQLKLRDQRFNYLPFLNTVIISIFNNTNCCVVGAIDFFKIKNPKNLEKVTRIFFNHRRKMLKKPFNQLFNGDKKIIDKLKIDLNLRPQNLDFDIYYKLAAEYENLRS